MTDCYILIAYELLMNQQAHLQYCHELPAAVQLVSGGFHKHTAWAKYSPLMICQYWSDVPFDASYHMPVLI
jgi:hypothetical protein